MLIWLVDFLAFHCASAILLETNAQIANVARMFFVPWRKMYRVWTTVEPEYYHPDPSVQKDPIWTCTFRAWLTPATGTEYIVEAARLLKRENIHFRFLVKGPLVDELRQLVQKEGLKHIEIDSKRYEFDELNQLILRGHIFLGQFSDHPRTARTIQFKTVEACALGLPYITADLPSNRELLTPGRDCLFVHPRNGEELAEKILTLKRDPQLRELLGRAAHELYRRELDPKILAERIFGIMQGMR
jgi:glycosyltransferase involved in cell wall biosynthesis